MSQNIKLSQIYLRTRKDNLCNISFNEAVNRLMKSSVLRVINNEVKLIIPILVCDSTSEEDFYNFKRLVVTLDYDERFSFKYNCVELNRNIFNELGQYRVRDNIFNIIAFIYDDVVINKDYEYF